MTTATTPRQPAKRAKGRAEYWSIPYTVDDPGSAGWTLYEKDYEAAVERMARAYLNAKAKRLKFEFSWKEAPESVRENVRAGIRAGFSAIGIAAPRKERGSR